MTIADISGQLLEHDYAWTKVAKEFAVLDLARRLIRWDGLPVPIRVARRLTFEQTQTSRFTFVRIFLNEPVKPGERLAMASLIQFPDALTWESILERRVEFNYFFGGPADELAGKFEVPCLAWYSGNPQDAVVNGGFDIFLAHSRKHRFSSLPPEPTLTEVVLNYNVDGRRITPPPFTLHGWKLRRVDARFAQNPRVDSLTPRLSVRGLLQIPVAVWLIPVLVIIINFFLAVFLVPSFQRWIGLR